MVDRPIIFSAPMVRALLAGRKTQTRRLIKPQPAESVTSAGVMSNSIEGQTEQWSWLSGDPRDCDTWGFEGDFNVRYVPGDRLYVRETWRAHRDRDRQKPTDMPPDARVWYEVDRDSCDAHGKVRVSIHMPRWASRLTLFVEDVRVERLQSISEADAIAEGTVCYVCGTGRVDGSSENECACFHSRSSAIPSYQVLWNSLHGVDAWDANPWVVAVTFRVERGNIDEVRR